jgi:hypothetical protein
MHNRYQISRNLDSSPDDYAPTAAHSRLGPYITLPPCFSFRLIYATASRVVHLLSLPGHVYNTSTIWNSKKPFLASPAHTNLSLVMQSRWEMVLQSTKPVVRMGWTEDYMHMLILMLQKRYIHWNLKHHTKLLYFFFHGPLTWVTMVLPGMDVEAVDAISNLWQYRNPCQACKSWEHLTC